MPAPLVIVLALLAALSLAPPAFAAPADDVRALTRVDALSSLAALVRATEARAARGDEAGLDQLLDEVGARGANAITRDHARFARARRVARRGDLEAARAVFGALGVVERAVVLGPLENAGGVAFDVPCPDEDSPAPPGFEIEIDPRDGRFDIGPALVGETDLRVCLVFDLVAERDTPVALRAGSAGQLAVVVNGEVAARFAGDRPLALDQTAAGVTLRRGANRVVLRLGAIARPLEARVRLTSPAGDALRGVRAATPGAGPAASPRNPPASVVEIADPFLELARFTSTPPLVRAPTADDDPLWDIITVERALRSRDQREAPRAHDLWLFALRTRLRIDGAHPGLAPPLPDVLVAIADSVVERDPTQARTALEEALAASPDHPRALAALAALRDQQGFTRDARALYARALALDDDGDGARADALRFLRNFSQDRPTLDRLILDEALRRGTPELARLAVDVAVERNDLELAAPALALLERLDEADATVLHVRLGLLAAGLADPDAAARAPAMADVERRLARRVAHFPSSHRDFRRLILVRRAFALGGPVDAAVRARAARFPLRPEPSALLSELALLDGDRAAAKAALVDALGRAPQRADLARTFALLDDGERELWRRHALAVEVARGEPPPGASDVGAYVAGHVVTARVFDNGMGTIVDDRVIRVLDAKKADGLRALRYAWSDGRERVQVLVAERHTADGRIEDADAIHDVAPDGKSNGVYSDERTRVVSFRSLDDGDVLHVVVRTDLVGRQNLFGDFFGRIEVVSDELPVENWRFVVDAPAARPLSWGGRGVGEPEVVEDEGRRVLRFEVARAPRLKVEPLAPPLLELASFVSVSTYSRWEDLGRWYAALIQDSLFVDDELVKLARSLVEGADGEREKVRRIYEYVVGNTRYVGIELGIHGWKPYPVTLVHRRKYGDCKDKASLLYAMLAAVDVDARIALVRTADLGRVPSTPASMWLFNHAIAYVPGLDLFLDGTAEHSGMDELPDMDQGGLALVVDPRARDPARLVEIPLDPAERNRNASSYVLELMPDGTMLIREGTERFSGAGASRERITFADAATRRERLERTLAEVFPGFSLLSLEVTDLSLSSSPVGYQFSGAVPSRATRGADGRVVLPISLYPHDLVESYAAVAERTTPLWISHPWQTRNVMRYVLPPGTRAVDLPASSRLDSDVFSFVQTITPTDDGFVVDEETTLKTRVVPTESFEAFRRDLAAADRLMRARVTLAADAGGDT